MNIKEPMSNLNFLAILRTNTSFKPSVPPSMPHVKKSTHETETILEQKRFNV